MLTFGENMFVYIDGLAQEKRQSSALAMSNIFFFNITQMLIHDHVVTPDKYTQFAKKMQIIKIVLVYHFYRVIFYFDC